jgi:superkiller protein 3
LILAELGRYDDSKNTYLAALELEPDYSELHNNLGLLFLKMKKLDEAVLSFEESVKKNVNNALAYVNLGKALLELEKFDDALKAYNQALEIDPANPEAREAIRLYKEGKIET